MRKALVIGLDNYNFARLNGCVNDANEITEVLSRNEDGSKNFHVKKLVDNENFGLRRANIKLEIEKLFSGDSDIALFYFSGHGMLNKTGGYIVTPDYEPGDEGISMDYILDLANKSRVKNKFIILDCCNSGKMGNLNSINSNLSQMGDGVIILTASREDESSIEENGHGIFTSLLLDALKGEASDILGNITMASIYAYIDSSLGPWNQRPIFKTNISTFTSVRKINPLIDINILKSLTKYFSTEEEIYQLDKTYEPEEKECIKEHTKIFAKLQKLVSIGLVKPYEAEHMYFAAINNKGCRLTNLGKMYWKLVKLDRI
ncbi:caspase family protein [uncultured Clostridium sp.]|uniref:caspase family protein n=1 Tax=uncultured Clostridium sp. TaxID=59620 RepID=UPI00261892EB|nr:caspase family protein [uncultured Clostridium sp.]